MNDLSTSLLRGGSGGGGRGGGGGGGGGYSYHGGGGGGGGYHGGGGDDEDVWLDFMFVGAMLALFLFLVFADCFGPNLMMVEVAEFDKAVSDAQKEQNVNSVYGTFVNGTTHIFDTYIGKFDMKYNDRGIQRSGIVNIELKDNAEKGGYDIGGDSCDIDGRATITGGFVSYSGGAWWVKETHSGADRGMKILTEGRFDFPMNIFNGVWRANTGVKGHYIEFKSARVYKKFKPLQEYQAEMLEELSQEEDLPTAIGTPLLQTPAPVRTVALAGLPLYSTRFNS